MKKFFMFLVFMFLFLCVGCTTFRARIGELKDGELEISKTSHQFIGVML